MTIKKHNIENAKTIHEIIELVDQTLGETNCEISIINTYFDGDVSQDEVYHALAEAACWFGQPQPQDRDTVPKMAQLLRTALRRWDEIGA